MSDSKDIEYLNDERIKLWEDIRATQKKLSSLEDLITKEMSEVERDARGASQIASKFKNRAVESAKIADEQVKSIETVVPIIKEEGKQIRDLLLSSKGCKDEIAELHRIVKESESEVRESVAVHHERINTLVKKEEEIQNFLETITQQCEEIESVHETSLSWSTKIEAFHSKANELSRAISEVNDQVFGYTDPSGRHVLGMKEKLEEGFDTLKAGFNRVRSDFDKKFKECSATIEENNQNAITQFKEFAIAKQKEVDVIKEKIKILLPDAMTAGLSAAYAKKRVDEEAERKNAMDVFNKSIIGLVVCAFIPFVVNIVMLATGTWTWQTIIDNIPRVVLMMLPLYAPIVWIALFANKRINLSKRLIEEYAHKEVISKTFEGLSAQISNLEEDATSKDLRERLLYNVVSLGTKNPGELIKDYNKPDNPLLDVLDKSLQFAQSMEKLSEVPGIGILFKRVAKIASDRMKEKQNQIAQVLTGSIDKEE